MRDFASTPELDIEIAAIASAVPAHRIEQETLRDIILSEAPEFRSHEALFLNTGIKARYSSVPIEWHLQCPGWVERNAVFRASATDLLERVARTCADRAGLAMREIEAIVTVTTTGLAVPGLDVIIANRLGLPATVERLPIFGLGCAGGVSGLARAARLAQSLPNGTVLLLLVELCTIHSRVRDRSIKNFVAGALFGDGAAGLILQRATIRAGAPRITAVGEHMWPHTEAMMGWSIEEDGFGIVLSPDIPKLARTELRPAMDRFLSARGLALGDLAGVVVHPGGSKVLESIEVALQLPRQAFRHAWDVLGEYGNMSSPTALFVLERTMRAEARGLHLLVAFGPGFTVSFALLHL